MPADIELLQNIDRLGMASFSGIQKNWPLTSQRMQSLRWDYLQKINYSIQDFNSTIEQADGLRAKDVVYLIAIDDWISSSVVELMNCYRSETISDFEYTKQAELDRSRKYMEAVRSFIMAHPLKTNRHPRYGLDGDLICIDICRQSTPLQWGCFPLKRLTIDGLVDVDELPGGDLVLHAYNKNDGGIFFVHIGFDPVDIRTDCELNIGKLYELDRHLGKLKKRDSF